MQARRHQYLEAMGIQVWQQRSNSFAANADTQTCEQEGIELTPPEIEDDRLQRVATSEDFISEQMPNSELPPLLSESEEVVERVVSDDNPRFRLASIAFADACLVVTQIPLDASEPINEGHIAYLKNLLFGLGITSVDQPQITLFNWPMLRGANFDQSSTAALEASQAFLRAQTVRYPVPLVLLMGEQAGRYLLPGAVDLATDRGRLEQDGETTLLLTESIESVISEPQLKTNVWSDLQAYLEL